VNTPHLNHSQTGWYSISLPQRDRRLSWPRWIVTYLDGLFTHPQTITYPSTNWAQCRLTSLIKPTPLTTTLRRHAPGDHAALQNSRRGRTSDLYNFSKAFLLFWWTVLSQHCWVGPLPVDIAVTWCINQSCIVVWAETIHTTVCRLQLIFTPILASIFSRVSDLQRVEISVFPLICWSSL